jgi:hypothetical protein
MHLETCVWGRVQSRHVHQDVASSLLHVVSAALGDITKVVGGIATTE